MERRLGVISVLVYEKSNINKLNALLSDYSDIIIGRMGLPLKAKKINLINIIVELNTNELGALTGKIGNIKGLKVKSIIF